MSNEKMSGDAESKPATLPTANSGSSQKPDLSARLQTVKSAWDKAPEGDKKARALKHYQSAEKAQKSGNDAEAMRELEEASLALS